MLSQSNTFVDVVYPLQGEYIPIDHGYLLLGAISRIVPALHGENKWSVFPIQGRSIAPGILSLTPISCIRIRLPSEEVAQMLGMAGKELEIDGYRIRLGEPSIHPIAPGTTLVSSIVTIKGFFDNQTQFESAFRRRIMELPGLTQSVDSISIEVGRRRVLKAGKHTVVGFSVVLSQLEMDAATVILQFGVGGRRHMGAGCFLVQNH